MAEALRAVTSDVAPAADEASSASDVSPAEVEPAPGEAGMRRETGARREPGVAGGLLPPRPPNLAELAFSDRSASSPAPDRPAGSATPDPGRDHISAWRAALLDQTTDIAATAPTTGPATEPGPAVAPATGKATEPATATEPGPAVAPAPGTATEPGKATETGPATARPYGAVPSNLRLRPIPTAPTVAASPLPSAPSALSAPEPYVEPEIAPAAMAATPVSLVGAPTVSTPPWRPEDDDILPQRRHGRRRGVRRRGTDV